MRVLGDQILVDPYYDPDKIGSLYIPDSAKNSESNQGRVIASGPRSGISPNDYILYHPFRGEPVSISGMGRLVLRRKDIVARAVGNVLYPIDDHVMVQPDWETKYKQPSGLVYLPQTALEQHQPCLVGTIIKIGVDALADADVQYQPGSKVLMQPTKGNEVAWIDTVYYFLRPSHILACLP